MLPSAALAIGLTGESKVGAVPIKKKPRAGKGGPWAAGLTSPAG